MITGPSTGLRDYLPGASGQKLILFTGAPNLIVTLFPPFALAVKRISYLSHSSRPGITLVCFAKDLWPGGLASPGYLHNIDEGHVIKMHEKLTAVFQKSPYGYIGYVEELPGANTQGNTLEETKKNLIEAVRLVLEANRQIDEEDMNGVFCCNPFFVGCDQIATGSRKEWGSSSSCVLSDMKMYVPTE